MPDFRPQRRKEKLLKLFDRHGLRPNIRFGQNFLLDKNQVNFIARIGEVKESDLVLEVGPGTGFLSRVMAETGATILAVELDRGMAGLVREEMADYPNFFLMEADILKGKNDINPDVLDRLREMLAARPDLRLKCVSNLPYSAGTPFAANLFASDLPWDSAAFLLQYEVGERLCAKENTSPYGALSIRAGLGGVACIARKVPPQVFWPRPRVDSAVVHVKFNPLEERMKMPWKALRQICIATFNSRRKNIRNALKGLIEKTEIRQFLEDAGIDPELRGQELTPQQFLQLAHQLEKQFPES